MLHRFENLWNDKGGHTTSFMEGLVTIQSEVGDPHGLKRLQHDHIGTNKQTLKISHDTLYKDYG